MIFILYPHLGDIDCKLWSLSTTYKATNPIMEALLSWPHLNLLKPPLPNINMLRDKSPTQEFWKDVNSQPLIKNIIIWLQILVLVLLSPSSAHRLMGWWVRDEVLSEGYSFFFFFFFGGGADTALVGELADQEDGRLKSQNNHLVMVWISGSFMDQRCGMGGEKTNEKAH